MNEIERLAVLALFLPLVNSAGGNSGSQSTALVVRALALGELRLSDWRRVLRRELLAGMSLGGLLGGIGWARIFLWGTLFGAYGSHFGWLAFVVAVTLVLVVAWGTVSGAMLPFVVARLGFDPATASAPFVATFVDVTAMLIYFQLARWAFAGVLL